MLNGQPPSMARARNPVRGHGFTLVELIVSLTVMGILTVGLASAIMLASHAIPEPRSPLNATIDASVVVQDIAGELFCATSFSERTATSIEFTVHDRDNDDVQETIRYEWSGTLGDPLTRQYNGGTVIEIAEDMHEFQLNYDLRTISREEPPTENESSETLLISHDASGGTLQELKIQNNRSCGEYFQPSLPADAVAWKITLVKFMAKVDGSVDGETLVQIRPPDWTKRHRLS